MKRIGYAILVVLYCTIILFSIAGCVVNKNESAGSGNEQAPGIVKTVVDAVTSWKGIATTAATGVGATWLVGRRGRKWKRAYHTTADVIESYPCACKADLKRDLQVAHLKSNVHDLTKKQARKYAQWRRER